MPSSNISRRNLLKTTAFAAASVVSAPYLRNSYAAGKLTLGVWDHWVPGANNTLTKLCNEWGEKNKVEVAIDYITSQGDKDLLTASAEAQARAGHDIMSHRAWQIQVHRNVLEPVDDIIKALVAKAGPISPVSEYLAKHDGKWFGIPTTVGSQVKPCCSRIDLYKQHCGIDLTAIFPPNDKRDPKLVDSWTWDLYLKSAEQLFKAGFPIGLPMGQTSDAIDSTGAMFRAFGSVMVDEKDNLKVDSNETRAALEYFKKLMAFNPPAAALVNANTMIAASMYFMTLPSPHNLPPSARRSLPSRPRALHGCRRRRGRACRACRQGSACARMLRTRRRSSVWMARRSL
jgi:ABC-type glycerol-3-phosphate transport system substrate-binding protein